MESQTAVEVSMARRLLVESRTMQRDNRARSCARARARARAFTLVELGVTAVRIYDGSLEEWSAEESLPLQLG